MTKVSDALTQGGGRAAPPIDWPGWGAARKAPGHRAARGGSDWNDLWWTTLKLAAVFWSFLVAVDSIIWGVAGVDPVASLGGKIALNGGGAILTIVITAVLYRLRRTGLLTKAVLAFLMATLASPLYAWWDLQIYRWHVAPRVVPFDIMQFGSAMAAASSVYFGWSCLFIALLYSFDVRDRERKLAAAREEALGAQMRALRYQINPHFLFNTLNSIAGLVEEGAAKRAERMVLSLSTFLRTTLELDPMNDVPLSEELALQEEYLAIEQERFPYRMTVAIDVADGVGDALVPSLILQPLVENAIKHGVGRSSEPVAIRIAAQAKGRSLSLIVENELAENYPSATPAGFGIGLRNVAERINARFGGEARFDAGPQDNGLYRAEIILPWRTATQ